jgi:hypothetical protein
MVLSIISALAGSLIALASVALLWKQKIYINSETKEITKIELPFGIKLQTNAPVLGFVFMGFALILIPVLVQKNPNLVALKGHIAAHDPLKVYAIAAQQETNGDVLLQVPGNALYTVMYLPTEGAAAIDSQSVDLEHSHNNPFVLPELEVPAVLAGNTGTIPTRPVQTVAPNVVNQYK